MKLRCKKSGFTLVEILTVLGIMALLTGVLVATGTVVSRVVREAKQRAQLVSIEQGLLSFRGDYGDYPRSDYSMSPTGYCGAMKLAEALLGWDLLGFHPQTNWDAAGTAYGPPTPSLQNLDVRSKPYLERGTESVFRVGNISGEPGLFNVFTPLAPGRFVICDSFGVRRIMVGGKSVKAGAPILYYKANPSSKTITGVFPDQRIYNVLDNERLVNLGSLTIDGRPGAPHPLGGNIENLYKFDYEGGVKDPKATAASGIDWPYRPDSYILISAGADGLYGTSDDITNFGN